MIEQEYDPSSNEIMKHESTNEIEFMEDKAISLDDCLRKFYDIERLSDELYCKSCEEHMIH
jgi:ubiquitin C-terminal hydrolase